MPMPNTKCWLRRIIIPGAIELMHKLSKKSRKRWPETAIAEPRLGV